MKETFAKVAADSGVGSLMPRYIPVDGPEVEEGDAAKMGPTSSLRWTPPHLFFACSVLSFLVSAGSAAGLTWGYSMVLEGLPECPGPGKAAQRGAAQREAAERAAERSDEAGNASHLESCYSMMLRRYGEQHTFKELTGVNGHIQPSMYGKVREKTIWSYWYDPVDCPSSHSCKLPAVIQLCAASIRKNRGDFDFHILHMDTARNFVSMIELPMDWQRLQPVRQKEVVMNALLARYGGVALDLSTVLLRPLDDLWTELLLLRATFKGYMYRVNGQPWEQPEATATWFLMSRREGVFSTAVRNQVINFCDAYLHPDLGLGDWSVTPVLGSINSSLPSCLEDQFVHDKDACPDPVQPRRADPNLDPPRTDRKLLIADPRDGPHLPFARTDNFGMGTWRINDTATLSGLPPQCSSPDECWQKVVLPRYRAGVLLFVKLFNHGGALARLSAKELLGDDGTFFHNWLQLAGVDSLDEKEEHAARGKDNHTARSKDKHAAREHSKPHAAGKEKLSHV